MPGRGLLGRGHAGLGDLTMVTRWLFALQGRPRQLRAITWRTFSPRGPVSRGTKPMLPTAGWQRERLNCCGTLDTAGNAMGGFGVLPASAADNRRPAPNHYRVCLAHAA